MLSFAICSSRACCLVILLMLFDLSRMKKSDLYGFQVVGAWNWTAHFKKAILHGEQMKDKKDI